MNLTILMLSIAVCAVLFRVLIMVFLKYAVYKVRFLCTFLMMILYTIVLLLTIFFVCSTVAENMSVTQARNIICVAVLALNLAFIFTIFIYGFIAKKRSLSGREKIMLKDL